MFRGYKLKFEFNAAHSNVDNHTENAHFHTFTIVLYLHDLDERMDYFFDIEKNINDVAGIRVVCSYIDDIYYIADALLRQDDIKLISKKDYIESPKPNGYRSLHLIVTVPVFLADEKKEVKVEVQIRTIAMDFWASLEHQLRYKKDVPGEVDLYRQLHECADVIADTDRRMLQIREKIEAAEDVPTEEELLFDRLRRLDMPLV